MNPNQTSGVQGSFTLKGVEIPDVLLIITDFDDGFSNVGKDAAACLTIEDSPTCILDKLGPRVGSSFAFSDIIVSEVEVFFASTTFFYHGYDRSPIKIYKEYLHPTSIIDPNE